MKTPPLLFSLPFLLSVFAVQAAETTSTPTTSGSKKSLVSEVTEGRLWTLADKNAAIKALTTPVTGQAQPQRATGDCCPKRDEVSITAPSIPTVSGELTKMWVRGEVRTLEVMTDQYHVRGKDGRQTVTKFPSKRELGEVDIEASNHQALTGDRADVIAYVPGRPRTDANKLLITKRVLVRLATGVTPSVFAQTTGAIRAQRISFAADALVLTYLTTSDAVFAGERLRRLPGVLDAEVVVASRHNPEHVPSDPYFGPFNGPEYNPRPNSDNVEGWQCFPDFCEIINTRAYQWWGNNVLNATGLGPLNMLDFARPDLGDFPPVEYDPLMPGVHGEQCDLRLPVAWENPGQFGNPIAGLGKKVLIIDVGIKKEHPDLQQAVDLNTRNHFNFMAFPQLASPSPVDPAFDSHGTSLAGIVGARSKSGAAVTNIGIAGVAPGCIFHSVVAVNGFVDDLDWAQGFALGSTLVDSDKDNDYLDEDRSGIVNFDICLNASSENAAGDAFNLYPETWLWKRAIRFGATRARSLGGVIYVTSAGNGGGGHNNTNYNESKNAIYQIPVGAVSDLGRRIALSNAGANLVCVAPSWGDELPPLLNWASSPGGSFGSRPPRKDPPIEVDDLPPNWRRFTQGITTLRSFAGTQAPTTAGALYDFDFNGTSASAAMVAGVVALMLEAKPNLSARDVKEILLRSCRVNNDVRVGFRGNILPTEWRMARTGKPMSHNFGAGLIDANRAVLIAKDWPRLPLNPLPPIKVNLDSPTFGKSVSSRNTETGGLYIPVAINMLIPLNPPGTAPEGGGPGQAIEIPLPNPPAGMRLEHIEVRVKLYHQRRGDLEIKLVAPPSAGWEDGRPLESILYAPHRDDYTESKWDQITPALRNPTDWTFTTVRHWGTRTVPNSQGNWKLVVRDVISRERTTPLETPPLAGRPKQSVLSADDPIYVPIDNPKDVNKQRIDGVGITYHGVFDKTLGNDPPELALTRLRAAPATDLTKIQLTATGLGTNAEGDTIYPITNWDFFNPVDIVPRQPGNAAREFEYLEYFPPARRPPPPANEDDLIALNPLLWPDEPAYQVGPAWLPFIFGPPPTSGPMGGLTMRPAWGPNRTPLEQSPDQLFMILRDPKNPNNQTNSLQVRLNRRTGKLGLIPSNIGKFTVSAFAESIIGMSQPRKLEITVALPTYDSWIGIHFPGETDPAIIGWDADPDGDTIKNGLEYAMRMDPSIQDSPVPVTTIDGTDVVFSFQEDTVATGSVSMEAFGAEVSTDLVTWSRIDSTVVGETNFLRDLEVRVPMGDERTFIRLYAAKAP